MNENTAIVYYTLEANIGNNNTAVGSFALSSNTISEANVAIRNNILASNSTGGSMVGVSFENDIVTP